MDILPEVDSSFLVGEKISGSEPVAIGKIGVTELRSLYYHRFNVKKDIRVFNDRIFVNCGVFPSTEKATKRFLDELCSALPLMDIMPIYTGIYEFTKQHCLPPVTLQYEESLILKYSPECKFIKLKGLEPYYFNNPWTKYLKNKKVLVISPFVDSIKKQYKKRDSIWEDPRILPDFDLITLKHQLSPAINGRSDFKNWNDMVESMKESISKIDFDIALIGTGASSLPLTAHCKFLGKKAIHLGGSLQVLFGIKGSRWEDHIIGKNFYNENWISPSKKETPKLYKENEDGCYW